MFTAIKGQQEKNWQMFTSLQIVIKVWNMKKENEAEINEEMKRVMS